jgi:two-component system, LytTR family, sensor kinase
MSKNKITTHIILWSSLYVFWILVFQGHSFAFSRTMTVEFCYLLFIVANFYFNVSFTIPHLLYQRKYILFTALFLGGIVTSAILRVPLSLYLNRHYFNPGGSPPGIYELFVNSFLNIFIWVICLVAGKFIVDRIRFQKYVENIENEKARTELDFLKAQFNPHFLFNSINSIYGHIDKNNLAARNMLLTFSEMLRYQLYECNTEKINIEKELSYLKNYIALQQSRKDENLIVKFEIDDNIKGFKIVPLLFVAFIENCFKYVSDSDEMENRVEISFRKINGALVFRTFNTKEKANNATINHKGIGVANARRRLELLYPDKYDLSIGECEQSHEVILKLQLS